MSYLSPDYVPVGIESGYGSGGSQPVPRSRGAGLFSQFEYHKEALRFAAFINVWTLIAVVVAGTVLLIDQKDKHVTVHYYLEGDDSVNGDTFRGVNAALWGTIVSASLLFLNLLTLFFRYRTGERDHPFAKTGQEQRFNLYSYFPVAVADGLMLLALSQSCGLALLWPMVYGTLGCVLGDFLLCMMRLSTDKGANGQPKLVGSSFVSVIVYWMSKFTPYILIFACIGARHPGQNPVIAVSFYFAFLAVRVLFSGFAFLVPMLSGTKKDTGAFRWVVMRVDGQASGGTTAEQSVRAYRDALDPYWGRHVGTVMFWGSIISGIAYFIVQFQTQLGFGSGPRAGREVYERITWTVTSLIEPYGETVFVQFDRTWPMGQYFVVLIFGLPMLFIFPLLHLFYRRSQGRFDSLWEDYWKHARDPYNAVVFGVCKFCAVWMLLSILGTTEFTSLLLGGLSTVYSSMLWAESRKNHSIGYSVLAVLAGLVPFVHAIVNYVCMVSTSKVELVALILLIIAHAAGEIFSFVVYNVSQTKDLNDGAVQALVAAYPQFRAAAERGIKDLYRVWNPSFVVAVRYALGLVFNFTAVICIYWLGGMHHGWEIVNNK